LLGFCVGVLLVVALNLYDLYRPRGGVVRPQGGFLDDVSIEVGFPFIFYKYGGFGGASINWSGGIADAAVALVVGVIFGWVSWKWYVGKRIDG
jgi:hypothetical protein